MTRLADFAAEDVRLLFEDVKARVRAAPALTDAAQGLCDALYERTSESALLARLFCTVPYGSLPERERAFVAGLLARNGAPEAPGPETPVLCLLGTRGREPEWNRRQDSRGHAAIPLMGPSFVAAIPMIARLLKELGVSVEGVEGGARLLLGRSTTGSLSRIFYVAEAAGARDDQGRFIIADQKFVRAHDVRSVFASGGAYMRERSFAVAMLFSSEPVPRVVAERFAPLASVFKTGTMALVEAGLFFGA